MAENRQLTLQGVFDLSVRALTGAGASPAQAAAAARSIEEAEADGIRTVGLAFLPLYCAHLKSGKVNGHAVPTLEQTGPTALVSNAGNGFAHTAFEQALDSFCTVATEQSMAGLAVVESYSAGVLAWFVERLADRGFVALGFANSGPLMAAHGGKKAFFGTNPMAFAAPRRQGQPALVLDQASSQVAYVTVKQAADLGETIPLGWGLDRHGQPTTDPQAVIDGGSMAPAAGHKGMLLALMVDVLAGGLAGPHFDYQVSGLLGTKAEPPRVGQFFIAIAPDSFAPAGRMGAGLGDRVEALLMEMTAEPGVRVPGARRLAHREVAAREGVSVPVELVDKLEAYAAGRLQALVT